MKVLYNFAWAVLLAEVFSGQAAFGFQASVDVPCRIAVSQGAQADSIDLATGLMKRGTTLLAGNMTGSEAAIAAAMPLCTTGALAQGIRAATTAPAVRPNGRWIVADLNNDGRPDSLVLGGDNSYTRQLGRSSGPESPVRVTVGAASQVLRVGTAVDVNRDGIPDLVACCSSPGDNPKIVVAFGNGDGTFREPRESVPGSGAFAAVDWNKDGVLDLVSASGGTLYISLGKTDGTFEVSHSTLNANGNTVLAADVTSDGLLDAIVVSNRGIRVFAGLVSGSVGQPVETLIPLDTANYAAIADFTGEGNQDIFVSQTSGAAAMLRGNGQGAFTFTGIFGVGHFENVDAADVAGRTGKVLVLPDESTASLQLVPVTSTGIPIAAPLYRAPNGEAVFADHSLARSNVAVADFDADGKDDIAMVVPVGTYAVLQVYRGGFVRGLPAADPIVIPSNSGTQRVSVLETLVADFDYDGWKDLLVVDSESENMLLFRNDQRGSFREALSTPLGTGIRSVVVGHFNTDTYPDVAVANGPDSPGSGRIRVFYGSASGAFGNIQTINTGVTPHRLLAADLNADFRTDIAYLPVAPAGSNLPLGIVLNRTNNQFLPPTTLALPPYASIGSRTTDVFGARDMNADGLVDLVVGIAFADGGLKVLQGDGQGGFVPKPAIPNSPLATAMVQLEDFNNDQIVDILAVHCCGDKTTQLYYGRGDGTFLDGRTLPTGGFTARSWIANVDGESVTDLVAQTASGVSVHPMAIPNLGRVSSAARASTALAVDSIASIYGANLATVTETAGAGGQTPLGETRMTITDSTGRIVDVPLFYASPAQLNFFVPPGLALGPAKVTVVPSKGATSIADVTLARIDPGVFVTGGDPSFVNAHVVTVRESGAQTWQLPYEVAGGILRALPVDLGGPNDVVVLVLYGTGIRGRTGLEQVRVTIGGVSAPVGYAGVQGQFPGFDQINVTIPRSLAGRGLVDVEVAVEGQASNTGRISIK